MGILSVAKSSSRRRPSVASSTAVDEPHNTVGIIGTSRPFPHRLGEETCLSLLKSEALTRDILHVNSMLREARVHTPFLSDWV